MPRKRSNDKVLKPVFPNLGIEAEYTRCLRRLMKSMHKDVLGTIRAAWKNNPPEMASDARAGVESGPAVGFSGAADALPSDSLLKALRKLTGRWQKRWEKAATQLAAYFTLDIAKRSDKALTKILRDAGISVNFKLTKQVRDVLKASMAQQVGLIKSIPQEYLQKVQGSVMRAVSTGNDLKTLTADLQKNYGVTKKRAAFIAADQTSKANATILRARHLELGIKRAVWMHSHGAIQPRPTHLKNDGKQYDIAKGWFDPDPKVQRYIQPGELVNCVPGDSIVRSFAGCKKLWRRWYSGQMTELVTNTGETVAATPNHPILTHRGWVPINTVREGEHIFKVSDESFFRSKQNIHRNVPKIAEVFDSASCYCLLYILKMGGWFHGDVADSEVEVIYTDRLLPRVFDLSFRKKVAEFFFANPDHFIRHLGLFGYGSFYSFFKRLFTSPDHVVCGFGTSSSFFGGRTLCGESVSIGSPPDNDPLFFEPVNDSTATYAEAAGKPQNAGSATIVGSDEFDREFDCRPLLKAFGDFEAPLAQTLGDNVRGKSKAYRYFTQRKSGLLLQQPLCVIQNRVRDFSGHVYNLETACGYYTTNGFLTQNCGCQSRPVVQGFT